MTRKLRHLFIGVALVALGFVVGAASLSALSVSSSRLFVAMLRFRFEYELGRLSSEALASGNAEAAVFHAACALEGEQPAFDPRRSFWTPVFPVMGFFSSENPQYGASDQAHYRALLRARYAVTLEEHGESGSAAQQLAEAVKIGGADATTWRRRGRAALGLKP
ncbi:hypothetical protein [Anaeromyxobacter terrae]|uniref:hypothetical protein n=1 Tax=Anaeromyxobacter terrae TaxID=2925406 RepID=UPI001F578B68|nr:hypothetical protein [Anaeromyxobacter sp. SG22]